MDIIQVEERLRDEMALRGMDTFARASMLYHVRSFLERANKDADALTVADAKSFLLYLQEHGRTPKSVQLALAAILFLCHDILGKKSFAELEQGIRIEVPVRY